MKLTCYNTHANLCISCCHLRYIMRKPIDIYTSISLLLFKTQLQQNDSSKCIELILNPDAVDFLFPSESCCKAQSGIVPHSHLFVSFFFLFVLL